MHRRQFLRQSGRSMAAIASIPLLIRKEQDAPALFRGEKTVGGAKWTIEIRTYVKGMTRFTAATEQEKRLLLKAEYRNTAANVNPDKTASFSYTIRDVLLLDDNPRKAEVWARFDKKESGELTLPPELPKEIHALVFPYSSYTLLDTKGKPFIELRTSSTNTSNSSSDSGELCFLTTACVQHKGLADDCYELQTLRHLRESFMRGTEEGDRILAEYRRIAPQIVREIQQAENRTELLDHLYHHLVVPSIQLIEAGKNQDAVDYYEAYVREGMCKWENVQMGK